MEGKGFNYALLAGEVIGSPSMRLIGGQPVFRFYLSSAMPPGCVASHLDEVASGIIDVSLSANLYHDRSLCPPGFRYWTHVPVVTYPPMSVEAEAYVRPGVGVVIEGRLSSESRRDSDPLVSVECIRLWRL